MSLMLSVAQHQLCITMLRKKLTEQLERETFAKQEAEESLEVMTLRWKRRAEMHDEALDQCEAYDASVKLILDTLQEVREENAKLQLQLAKWNELFYKELTIKATSDWKGSWGWWKVNGM